MRTMDAGQTHDKNRFAWSAIIGLAYFALAYLSLYLTKGADGIATVWPPSGIFLAGLLLARPGERKTVYGSVAIASLLANYLAGTSLAYSSAFTLANLLEGAVAMCLIGRYGRGTNSFANPIGVLRFCVAATAAGLASATLANLIIGTWSMQMFTSWSTTVILGMLMVTPLIVTMAKANQANTAAVSRARLIEICAILLLVLVVTLGVFLQDTYPLLFLPLIAVVVATYRLGPPGTACSILLIALVGSTATAKGGGLINLVSTSDEATVLFFQFYLLVLLATSLPLAAMFVQRERLVTDLRRSNSLLEMAEQAANVGHWRFDKQTNHLLWSAEVFRIHGVDSSEPPSVKSAIAYYHPDDRSMVAAALQTTMATGEPFQFEARIVRADGTVRHVESNGDAETNSRGRIVAVFGMVKDVTDRVLSEIHLEEARKHAESDARRAEVLAETDQLTGIANRRKVMSILRGEIARAEAFGSDLALAIVDIDRFKSINDVHGHAVGDEVLVTIAEQCCVTVGAQGMVGRLGGEEFVIVMGGASAETAYVTAENVRKAIAAMSWDGLHMKQVTASIGLTAFRPGSDQAALLKAADSALYQAKRDGRNLLRQAA